MLVLRLDQVAELGGGHRVEVSLSGPGLAPQRASVRTSFAMSSEDHERVRWYLEDYLEFPVDPAPTMAREVEARLAALGEELFAAVLGSGAGQRLWGRVQGNLAQLRVEVATEVEDATALPWELLRDPVTGTAVALEAGSFVRVNHATSRPVDPAVLEPGGGGLRVLLVICRPAGDRDVPFRSVAARLVGVHGAGEGLEVEVLRPPTFARLAEVLEQARQAGRPFRVVHFDGHGTYLNLDADGDVPDSAPGGGGGLSPHRYAGRNFVSPPRPGRHGFLLFEDPQVEGNEQLVDGPALGALLAGSGVGVLVLNACRSAYAEAPSAPAADPEAAATSGAGSAGEPDVGGGAAGVHGRVRAYGSLALEVADAGVAGVVAMRYSVYVVTAAQFVADLYAALLAGRSLGDAVSAGRRQLAAQPNRSIAFDPVPLQDWTVPVVYESVPLMLCPPRDAAPVLTLDAQPGAEAVGVGGLPRSPDVGFFGRDETLLALDRAFDRHRVVLLHAFAGQGKTSTVVEFARWYAATGGLSTGTGGESGGVVVFSSLEHHTPLSRLLNDLADKIAPLLAANNIPWQALDDLQRRQITLQVLGAVPVLWIWDNVEPVAGFPTPADSPWSVVEQRELADFLRDAAKTKVKVLLTSRRDEHRWLGDLPTRVGLPAMPMRERIQLTKALAERYGHRIGAVQDWRPLLRYTAGNPLTITVLVGQALRQRLTSRAQIEQFVARLRAGEGDFDDDTAQGRDRSLAVSLSYGFATAFDEGERARLGVLYVFQDTVDVDALVDMGAPDNPHRVAALAGLTRQEGIGLLDRAAQIGLLSDLGGGWYMIHPALPWFFRRLHPTTTGPAGDTGVGVLAAYTAAIAALGNHYHGRYEQGRHEVVGVLRVEEANLLHARTLARRAGGWVDVIGCMQGLGVLYEHTGRGAEWARLVAELVPDLVDPDTGGPHPDREQPWVLLTDYRIRIAMEGRDWAGAEHLARTTLAHHRAGAAGALTVDAEQLSDTDRHRIRQLAVSEHLLGDILRERNDPDCVTHYTRAGELCRRIGARRDEAMAAFNLGHAYLDLPQVRDLDAAERWYRHSLDLRDEHDRHGRAQTTGQLGSVAYQRFRDARAAGEPDDVLLEHLDTALAAYQQALTELPADAVTDLAVVHNQLGAIYANGGVFDAALHHYQQAIRYQEGAGNRYGAGQTRYNVAILLARAGRAGDGLLYAHAALRDYETYGASAAADIDDVQQLISLLEQPDPAPAGT